MVGCDALTAIDVVDLRLSGDHRLISSLKSGSAANTPVSITWGLPGLLSNSKQEARPKIGLRGLGAISGQRFFIPNTICWANRFSMISFNDVGFLILRVDDANIFWIAYASIAPTVVCPDTIFSVNVEFTSLKQKTARRRSMSRQWWPKPAYDQSQVQGRAPLDDAKTPNLSLLTIGHKADSQKGKDHHRPGRCFRNRGGELHRLDYIVTALRIGKGRSDREHLGASIGRQDSVQLGRPRRPPGSA